MNASFLAEYFAGIVALVAFLCFFYGPWQNYVIDSTRQRLFELRDQLFDHVSQSETLRDSDSHRTTREILNGFIRFSHESEFVRLLAFALASRWFGLSNSAYKEVMAAVNRTNDPNFRVVVNRTLEDAYVVMSLNVLRRSLVLLGLAFVFVLPLVLIGSFTGVLRFARRFGRMLVNAVNAEAPNNFCRV